ncbi:unnamed protein product [Meganyctiphanes norvegica]|uniref:Uncharacterized protein n=1 Tax=Meganyctiphanes norvegica TaxID=48144 RepID=A0AAV2RSM4_MEGNR
MKNELSGFFLVNFSDLQKKTFLIGFMMIFCKSGNFTKKNPETSFFIRFQSFLDQIVWKSFGLDKKYNKKINKKKHNKNCLFWPFFIKIDPIFPVPPPSWSRPLFFGIK